METETRAGRGHDDASEPAIADPRAWGWLGLGAVVIAAANARWGIGILAWVAPLPFIPGGPHGS